MKPFLLYAALAALFAIPLTDRIDSSDPILAESRPVRGPEPNEQLYASRKGYATEPGRDDYTWNRELNAYTGAYTLATAARQKDESSLAIRLSDTANHRASGGSFPRGCRANSDVRARA